MKKIGINDIPPSYGDILYLIYNEESGHLKDIVNKSRKDKSTVSNIINQLEQRGYVEKKSDPDDGRRTIVQLTPQCKSNIEAVSDISSKLKQKLFKGMSEEEQSILFMLLNKVEKNLKI
ncbi:MAG: MarR family transcriptional regulator [Desulfobacterales bacterium]|nr:MarR family transcriptional regulator [Desulfobacterales bacterium]